MSDYKPIPGKIPGRPVNLSGNMLVLAPLTLDQIQELEGKMNALGQGDMKAQIDAALPIILASIQRNYPDMTLEQLRPLMDLGNLREATEAVTDVSGFKRVLPGEVPPAGQ